MSDAPLTCANHPDRETGLRCNRCGKPICSECAVLTPVGYRCRQCVRQQQQQFETANPLDFVLVALVGVVGGGIGSLLLGFFNLWGLFIAPVIGGVIADAAQRVTRPRRSRMMPWIAAGGIIVGVLVIQLWQYLPILPLLLSNPANLAGLLPSLLWPSIHGALMVIATFSRMKGIRF